MTELREAGTPKLTPLAETPFSRATRPCDVNEGPGWRNVSIRVANSPAWWAGGIWYGRGLAGAALCPLAQGGELQCSASHQARAFPDIQETDEDYPPAVATMHIEHWIVCVVYFTLDKAFAVATLDDLWAIADKFVLPELIVAHRPTAQPGLPARAF